MVVETNPGVVSGLEHDLMAAVIPGGKPPSGNAGPGCSGFVPWVRRHGGVDGGHTLVRVIVQGLTATPVLIAGLSVRKQLVGGPVHGTEVMCPGTQGEAEIRAISVDLDRTPAAVLYDLGRRIPSRVEGLAVSGDGATVVAGSDDGGASVWRIRDGEARETGVAVPYESNEQLALNETGTLLAVMGEETIHVYDLHDARPLAALHVALPLPLSGNPEHGEVQQPYAFGFNAASTRLVLVGLPGAEAWSLATKHRTWSLRCECGATDVALSDNARYAVFGTTGGQATLLDLRDRHQIGEVVVTTAHRDETDAVQTDDRGQTLVAARNDALSIWRSPNQLTPPSIQRLTSERIESLAITADGDRILAGTAPHYVKFGEAPEPRIGPTWLVALPAKTTR